MHGWMGGLLHAEGSGGHGGGGEARGGYGGGNASGVDVLHRHVVCGEHVLVLTKTFDHKRAP